VLDPPQHLVHQNQISLVPGQRPPVARDAGPRRCADLPRSIRSGKGAELAVLRGRTAASPPHTKARRFGDRHLEVGRSSPPYVISPHLEQRANTRRSVRCDTLWPITIDAAPNGAYYVSTGQWRARRQRLTLDVGWCVRVVQARRDERTRLRFSRISIARCADLIRSPASTWGPLSSVSPPRHGTTRHGPTSLRAGPSARRCGDTAELLRWEMASATWKAAHPVRIDRDPLVRHGRRSAHNPEVAGSNPASATKYAGQSPLPVSEGAFCTSFVNGFVHEAAIKPILLVRER
jgi:hypothetical protein